MSAIDGVRLDERNINMPELESITRRTAAQRQGEKTPVSRLLTAADEVVRRLIDVVGAGLAILLLSPLYILIAILIKRDSSGPVIYRGARMGRNGKIFKIIKFRTMYEDDHSYAGPRVTAQDDPRITPVGRWLRDTKINELPQLWNILVGDMSWVGPRPEDPAIAAQWPDAVARAILSVRPGLTSPASVLYRHEESLLSSASVMDKYLVEILPTKLRLDYLYVRNRTVLTDLDVIFWTFVVLLPRLDNFTVPEYLLYWGPLSRFTARYLLWFVSDLLISFAAVGLAGVIWRLSAPLDIGWDNSLLIALVIAGLFSLVNFLMGLSQVDWNKAGAGGALDLTISTGIVTLVLFVTNLMLPGGRLLPPTMLVVAGMFALFGFLLLRYRGRMLGLLASRWMKLRTGRMNVLGERVLIVGAGEVGQFATWLLRNGDLSKAFSIVGYVDDDPRNLGLRVDGVRVIGTTDDIPALLEKHDIGLIMFAIANIAPADQEAILRLCRSDQARLILVPDLLDSLRAHFPTRGMDRFDLFSRVLRNTTLDKLTGVYNRNHFIKLAEQELPRSRRYQHPLSLVVFRVDQSLGEGRAALNGASSEVLREVARRTQRAVREIDLVGRIGEHIFAVLLPETEGAYAIQVANRLERLVEREPVTTDHGSLNPSVTLSVVADDGDALDAMNLIERALSKLDSQMAVEK